MDRDEEYRALKQQSVDDLTPILRALGYTDDGIEMVFEMIESVMDKTRQLYVEG